MDFELMLFSEWLIEGKTNQTNVGMRCKGCKLLAKCFRIVLTANDFLCLCFFYFMPKFSIFKYFIGFLFFVCHFEVSGWLAIFRNLFRSIVTWPKKVSEFLHQIETQDEINMHTSICLEILFECESFRKWIMWMIPA